MFAEPSRLRAVCRALILIKVERGQRRQSSRGFVGKSTLCGRSRTVRTAVMSAYIDALSAIRFIALCRAHGNILRPCAAHTRICPLVFRLGRTLYALRPGFFAVRERDKRIAAVSAIVIYIAVYTSAFRTLFHSFLRAGLLFAALPPPVFTRKAPARAGAFGYERAGARPADTGFRPSCPRGRVSRAVRKRTLAPVFPDIYFFISGREAAATD